MLATSLSSARPRTRWTSSVIATTKTWRPRGLDAHPRDAPPAGYAATMYRVPAGQEADLSTDFTPEETALAVRCAAPPKVSERAWYLVYLLPSTLLIALGTLRHDAILNLVAYLVVAFPFLMLMTRHTTDRAALASVLNKYRVRVRTLEAEVARLERREPAQRPHGEAPPS